jgi:hypothetical protein
VKFCGERQTCCRGGFEAAKKIFATKSEGSPASKRGRRHPQKQSSISDNVSAVCSVNLARGSEPCMEAIVEQSEDVVSDVTSENEGEHDARTCKSKRCWRCYVGKHYSLHRNEVASRSPCGQFRVHWFAEPPVRMPGQGVGCSLCCKQLQVDMLVWRLQQIKGGCSFLADILQPGMLLSRSHGENAPQV